MMKKNKKRNIKNKKEENKIYGRKQNAPSIVGGVGDMTVKDVNFLKLHLAGLMPSHLAHNYTTWNLMFVFFNNIDSKNRIYMTQKQMSFAIKKSENTVSAIIKKLRDTNLIVMERYGVYILNPEIFSSVEAKKRLKLIREYYENKKEDEERVDKIRKKRNWRQKVKDLKKKDEEKVIDILRRNKAISNEDFGDGVLSINSTDNFLDIIQTMAILYNQSAA